MCACSSNAQLTRSLSRAPVAEAPRRLSVKQKQEGVEQQSKKGGKNTAGGRRASALHTKMGSTPPAIPWQQPNILFPPPTATGGGGGEGNMSQNPTISAYAHARVGLSPLPNLLLHHCCGHSAIVYHLKL